MWTGHRQRFLGGNVQKQNWSGSFHMVLLVSPRSRYQMDFHGSKQPGSQLFSPSREVFCSLCSQLRCYPHHSSTQGFPLSGTSLHCSYVLHHKPHRRKIQQILNRSTKLCLSVLIRESIVEKFEWLFCSQSRNPCPNLNKNSLGYIQKVFKEPGK